MYDQIDLAPREHEQASGILQVSRNTAALPRNASALPRNVTSHLSHVSSQYRGNASSPPQPQVWLMIKIKKCTISQLVFGEKYTVQYILTAILKE